uniref:Tcl1 family Akt coactivator A n=1 Tax=Rattus norvegicus TaxID=10116 RepID=A0ABK0LI80_RAT
MANQLAYRPETPPHPDRLWLWEKHVYLDEFRRSWLPIVIKSNGKFQVIMRQKDVILGDSMTPSQLVPYELPLMWQLYPEESSKMMRTCYLNCWTLSNVETCTGVTCVPTRVQVLICMLRT